MQAPVSTSYHDKQCRHIASLDVIVGLNVCQQPAWLATYDIYFQSHETFGVDILAQCHLRTFEKWTASYRLNFVRLFVLGED